MKPCRYALLILLFTLLLGCDFQKEADAKFGDQNFKTAIALIELHKVRYGHYPEQLSDIKYAGDWDGIGTSSVEYKRIGNGYELNITRGWVGAPTLSYPPDFWQGLGIVATNVGGLTKRQAASAASAAQAAR
ncbi:hypothetical protein SAMN02745857_03034 [Andreprevotia lacus DSM 23236]|uniref:Uncharacterized protein n=1 Tax=Andreprevotia lacus DSM 23236 TaxID=1121001 RepID=A0A1W1XWN8_9NEIS|nr:hypothetical protein [Andreprevotia lacus]SMC27928.1 hypothetical protein SAMN02745857_03034 [Andreprevotia lacus DSM 23236]